MSELKRGLHDLPPSEENDVDPEVEDVDPEVDSEDLESAHEVASKRGRFRRGPRRKKRRRKRRLTLAVLPTLLTLGNGVCGLAAIAVAMSVNLDWDNETKLLVAGILIFVGMLFDALDGSAARGLIKALQSELCKDVTVLIKASRAMRLERVSDALSDEGEA